jgi:glycosyltransferase involved in cell wall biosynthesis
LPGEVEYPIVDVARFSRTTPRGREGGRMVIGRHSRDDKLKHHPNDPALYRQLIARGHRLRLLGGTLLQAAFSGDPAVSAVELLPQGSEDARDFLSGLDCFIYRKHPQFFETCGACILEAMSTGVPVILFREGVGAAELVEHGRDGFLVETEAEALTCIDRLAADPDLRLAIGAAARRKVATVMQDQQTRIPSYYLGSA